MIKDLSRSTPSIVIVGAGVIGSATGRVMARRSIDVSFSDSSIERRSQLQKEGWNALSADEMETVAPTAYFISVPTPTIKGHVDLEILRSACKAVGRSIRQRQDWALVVVRSTVPPGTCDGLVRETIECESAKIAGEGFGISMNPEFLRAISAEDDCENPKVIVIGSDSPATEKVMRDIYSSWENVPILAMSNA